MLLGVVSRARVIESEPQTRPLFWKSRVNLLVCLTIPSTLWLVNRRLDVLLLVVPPFLY